jgi:hypothetical protein
MFRVVGFSENHFGLGSERCLPGAGFDGKPIARQSVL